MIIVRVRIQRNDGQLGELSSDFLNIADAYSSIEEQSLLVTDNQIADDFFSLMRLVDRKNSLANFVHFKPGIADSNPPQRFVFGPRQRPTPFRNLGLRKNRGFQQN